MQLPLIIIVWFAPMAKQTQLPFLSSSITTKSAFDYIVIFRVHIKFQLIREHVFILQLLIILADIHESFLCNINRKRKKRLQSFIIFVKTQFHVSIKTIRVDNGLEFSMKEYF